MYGDSLIYGVNLHQGRSGESRQNLINSPFKISMRDHHPVVLHLEEHGVRLLQIRSELLQPLGSHCPIDDTVVAVQGDLHNADDSVTILLARTGNLTCLSHRQDTRLWWIDDGGEMVNSKHSQVRYSERPSHELCRQQLLLPGLRSQFLSV